VNSLRKSVLAVVVAFLGSSIVGSVAHAGNPTISSFSPTALATGVAVDANLVITFSEAVSAESGQISIITWTGRTLHETIRVSDSSKVSLSGATVTINPTRNLENNTRYFVKIDSGAFQSVDGDVVFGGIDSEGTWNFTTVAAAAATTTVAPTTTTTVALPKLGGKKCPRVGRTRTVGGVKFVCKKTTKLVWRRA
jgi:methionine-rich copper-binding protein CopC